MSFYDEDEDFDQEYDDVEEEFDEDAEDDDETLKELDVDENGHVIEGRRKPRRSRDDEYEDEEYE